MLHRRTIAAIVATLVLAVATAAPATTRQRQGNGACRDCGVVAAITPVTLPARQDHNGTRHPARRIYQVSVRMNDGSTKAIRYDNRPALAVGDRVRVTPRRVYLR